MRINLDKKNIIKVLVLLAFSGFMGYENYICVLILGIFLLSSEFRYITTDFMKFALILCLHVLIYVYNYSIPSLDWLAKNFLNPLALMYCGYFLSQNRRQSEMPCWWLLVHGFFIHGVLNVALYLFNPSTLTERTMENIWGGQMTATLQAIFFIPIAALILYNFFIDNNLYKKIYAVAGLLITLYCAAITASRTIIYIVLILAIISFIISMFKYRDKVGRISIYVMISLVLILACYAFNIFGIRSFWENSDLYIRITSGISENDSLSQNIRWSMSLTVLTELKTHPFGKITAVNYAHNLFLDIAKYTGIFPALFIFIFFVRRLVKFSFSFVFRKMEVDKADLGCFLISIGFMIVFFLEPILDGLPIAFSAYCFLCGIINARMETTINTEESLREEQLIL